MTREARRSFAAALLRFLDMGVSGGNFVIAETGSVALFQQ
jgi:L-lactate utilization protein LutB